MTQNIVDKVFELSRQLRPEELENLFREVKYRSVAAMVQQLSAEDKSRLVKELCEDESVRRITGSAAPIPVRAVVQSAKPVTVVPKADPVVIRSVAVHPVAVQSVVAPPFRPEPITIPHTSTDDTVHTLAQGNEPIHENRFTFDEPIQKKESVQKPVKIKLSPLTLTRLMASRKRRR